MKAAQYERPCRCEPNPFQCVAAGCKCVGCGCMKERPLLFTGGNVVEIREDRKTQTRRIVKPQPALGLTPGHNWFDPAKGRSGVKFCRHDHSIESCDAWEYIVSPYGKPGDRLWVRETWAVGRGYDADASQNLARAKVSDLHMGLKTWYRADDSRAFAWHNEGTQFLPVPDTAKWPHPKARGQWRPSIFMPRWASRLQLEVTRVRVERLNSISREDAIAEGVTQFYEWALDPVGKYRELWESINGPGSWALNPWVWCIDFKRIEVTCG